MVYSHRERTRAAGVVSAVRELKAGGRIRYRSVDKLGQATTEFDLIVLPSLGHCTSHPTALGEHGQPS